MCDPSISLLPIAQSDATADQLFQALHRLLVEAGVDEEPITTVVPKKRLSLRLKMAEIARKISNAGELGIRFDDLFELPCPLYDIVLTFLALLELLKMERVRVEQKSVLATIWLFIIIDEIGL